MTDPNYTHLALIVDRSGSMATIRSDMEGAIKTLLQEQAAADGELHVDVWTFDSKVEHPYQDSRADDIKGELIVPRGSTALNDAIGKAVYELGARFDAKLEDERPGKVIVAIVTDGQENSSTEYTTDAVKALVETQKNDYQWDFVFLGADSIDAFAVAGSYGIGHGSTFSFAASSAGTQAMGQSLSGYTTRSRAGQDPTFTEAERKAASS